MDSIKIPYTSWLIFFPCLGNENKEDLRSPKLKNSPLLVFGLSRNEIYPLVWCNEKTDNNCRFCDYNLDSTIGYYLCKYFVLAFHKECIEPIRKNPYHPKHPLQRLICGELEGKMCYLCYSYKYNIHYCYICDFSICFDCLKKPALLTINHTKRHPHTLFYIPKLASMTCDVCAVDDRRYFLYVCLECDFAVHVECIYFPRVIKISRHRHRLSFTSSFLVGKRFCGMCQKVVDENYGGYSCVKDCCYVVHSKCATHTDVWDGEELEEEPEHVYETVFMTFIHIGDDIIQHFSHSHHHMKLNKNIANAFKENLRCQACALDIYDGDIFSCMQCDFVLHKVCAHLPRKKQHAMHPHALVLQACDKLEVFVCSTCRRLCNGFVYKCQRARCNFSLDIQCATLSEPVRLEHLHPHQLFLPATNEINLTLLCSICQNNMSICLNCGECDFKLCIRCVRLPKTCKYKHDDHLLVYSSIQNPIDIHLCDICEEEIYMRKGSYMCSVCKVTLHIECLLGKDMYILPGKRLKYADLSANVLSNNHLTRYICDKCHNRCRNKVVYERFNKTVYCSLICLGLNHVSLLEY